MGFREPFVTIRGRPADGPGFSSVDSTYGSQGGPCSSPPRRATHNISRARYHMNDIGEFARSLEESAAKAFPNRLRTCRYTKVHSLLLHWESDDLFVLPEVQDLGKCFDEVYHWGVEYFMIPIDNSHLELMMKIGLFLKQFESPDTLLLVYYGGHARIDESRQSTWCATRDGDSAWLQWSAIQTLLERSPSDVLILLDCCAGAASATFPNGDSVTETISASSWDAIAPDPGRYSFTSALIEVMSDWENRAFSAAMLHAEVLARLKHPRPELRNGRHYEARATPVHFMMTANHKKPSIELCKWKEQDPCLSSGLPGPGLSPTRISPPETPVPGPTVLGDSIDPPMEVRSGVAGQGADVALYNPEPTIETPHVMISLALEREQRLDVNAWEQWLGQFPALAKYIKVQGVFESHSTLLLLSVPISIWSMLPDHDACNFVAFIRSNNLAAQMPASSQSEAMRVGQSARDSIIDHAHPDNFSLHTNLTGSTAVFSDLAPVRAQQDYTSQVSRSELSRSRSLNMPGPPPPQLDDVIAPSPFTRSGTTANIFNRTLRKATRSTLSLQQHPRHVTAAALKKSPSSSCMHSTQQQQGPVPSNSNLAYQPLMTQARATRMTNFSSDAIHERPDFSDHVEVQLEKYYRQNPFPSDGFKELVASNLGVEVKDVAVSLA